MDEDKSDSRIIKIKRAYSQEEKLIKRDKIIEAADKLLVKGSFPLPSVNQIIKEAGVAKGTVYLYFKSKEEIYLGLLSKYFLNFESYIFEVLANSSKKDLSRNLANAYIEFAKKYPKGVYIATIAPLILENNLSSEFILVFKTGIADLTQQIVLAIKDITKHKSEDEIRTTFLVSYNMFLGSWQHCNPPTDVAKVLKENDLSKVLYNFESEFLKHFELLWRPITAN